MQTKLTLRLDDKLIRRAKRLSKKNGKSVSQMVADFFTHLEEPDDDWVEKLTPTVRSMLGVLKGSKLDEKDYKAYLEKKYL